MYNLIEAEIKNWLNSRANKDSTIYSAIEHAVIPGGKRFRPKLCLLTSKILNHPIESVLPFAVSMELVHTYSLIHDDLPSMDNADTRRGVASVHKKFGDGIAVLAGSYLLTEAFLLLSKHYSNDITKLVSNCTKDMIYGQSLDITSDSRIDIEQLYELKSGKLIQCCVLGACMICNATNEDTNSLKKFAQDLGFAFQIVDDIRENNPDRDNFNYVKIKGLKYSRNRLKTLLESSKENLKSFTNKEMMIDMIDQVFKDSL